MHTAEHLLSPTVLRGSAAFPMPVAPAALAPRTSSASRAALWRAAATAPLLASAANAALYLAGAPLDLFPSDVLIPGALTPITLVEVVRTSALGAAAGVGTFALVRRHAADPARAFLRIVLAALLLSYTQPTLVLHDAPVRMALALDVLHTAAAAATLWALRGPLRAARRRPRAHR